MKITMTKSATRHLENEEEKEKEEGERERAERKKNRRGRLQVATLAKKNKRCSTGRHITHP
jgi:hypothetical protein